MQRFLCVHIFQEQQKHLSNVLKFGPYCQSLLDFRVIHQFYSVKEDFYALCKQRYCCLHVPTVKVCLCHQWTLVERNVVKHSIPSLCVEYPEKMCHVTNKLSVSGMPIGALSTAVRVAILHPFRVQWTWSRLLCFTAVLTTIIYGQCNYSLIIVQQEAIATASGALLKSKGV